MCMKVCTKCKLSKELTEFHKDLRQRSGLRPDCKSCWKLSQKSFKTSPELRNAHYLKTYGITLAQYNELFISQKGCCAICDRHQDLFNRALSVDHCHSSGQIRGLLCDECNKAIGYFKDKTSLLYAAVYYLLTTLKRSA